MVMIRLVVSYGTKEKNLNIVSLHQLLLKMSGNLVETYWLGLLRGSRFVISCQVRNGLIRSSLVSSFDKAATRKCLSLLQMDFDFKTFSHVMRDLPLCNLQKSWWDYCYSSTVSDC